MQRGSVNPRSDRSHPSRSYAPSYARIFSRKLRFKREREREREHARSRSKPETANVKARLIRAMLDIPHQGRGRSTDLLSLNSKEREGCRHKVERGAGTSAACRAGDSYTRCVTMSVSPLHARSNSCQEARSFKADVVYVSLAGAVGTSCSLPSSSSPSSTGLPFGLSFLRNGEAVKRISRDAQKRMPRGDTFVRSARSSARR